ncbi:probable methyltransferase-like protein 24 [Haliotis rufescens]|uniref:probable methyltransferase-like protein 24 n=1 Tax=Haliotis rufescens TaxID=6454 RepID=UPI00201EFA44|nr:probable methyltransferase-like protein 24 [Haliotis rufescens]XP_048253098.1 probable methyltransferase-like protein 24 [Haliotis rufescens]
MGAMKGRSVLVAVLACVVVGSLVILRQYFQVVDMTEYRDDFIYKTSLEELRGQGQIILPDKAAIDKLSAAAVFRTYHSYLDNVDILCSRKLRMGRLGDGGWEICDDREYRPVKPCIVYSFGINYDYSFDDAMAKNYECDVFSFDPSMKKNSYQRSARVRFLNIGIDGENTVNGNWEMHTLGRVKAMLNHNQNAIDVLKMDVESSEWRSLPEMVASRDLRSVRQLLVEYHGKCTDRDACIQMLKVLKDVYDLGFRKFYVHKNPGCHLKSSVFPVERTFCYEIHYVNTNLKAH